MSCEPGWSDVRVHLGIGLEQDAPEMSRVLMWLGCAGFLHVHASNQQDIRPLILLVMVINIYLSITVLFIRCLRTFVAASCYY